MTPKQVELVQSTADAFLSVSDRVADAFYDRLFELAPDARSMFPDDMTAQKRKLRDTLGTLLDHLLHMDLFTGHLRSLGRHHVRLGVLGEHYGPAGTALVHALRAALGSRFSPEVEDAWTALYGEIAAGMVQ